jgi:hypothetical protein
MPALLSKHSALVLAVVLSLLMWLTRGQHVASLTHLPDASWAIFFLLGFYLRQRMMLPLFLAQAALVDYFAITHFGASDYCVTSAYVFLLPAYSALWLSGHWYATRCQLHIRTLPLFAATAMTGALICELISSGSFYFLGGRFADTSLRELVSRLVQYFPADLSGVALYLGCAALIHVLVFGAERSPTAIQ